MQAERILAHCTQQGRVRWYWYKFFKDSTQQSWAGAIRPLPSYMRQYKGLTTKDGQRVVWINAFPKKERSYFRYWQTMEVEVQDGADAFFNIYVNLDTQQCFNFFRNSIGGCIRDSRGTMESLRTSTRASKAHLVGGSESALQSKWLSKSLLSAFLARGGGSTSR